MKDELLKNEGKKINALRKALGHTMEYCCIKTHINVRTWQRAERGQVKLPDSVIDLYCIKHGLDFEGFHDDPEWMEKQENLKLATLALLTDKGRGKPLPSWLGELCDCDPSAHYNVGDIAERFSITREQCGRLLKSLVPWEFCTYQGTNGPPQLIFLGEYLSKIAKEYNLGKKYREKQDIEEDTTKVEPEIELF